MERQREEGQPQLQVVVSKEHENDQNLMGQEKRENLVCLTNEQFKNLSCFYHFRKDQW